MRGTEFSPGRPLQKYRFIPAYAGNSTSIFRSGGAQLVHPRVCGEQPKHPACNSMIGGSSPRMRGTECDVFLFYNRRRFIPAYAGNRPGLCLFQYFFAVHPRVCGEQSIITIFPETGDGSSPRMRGTAARRVLVGATPRFIPAYAGNSQHLQKDFSYFSVHPRVCGEQTKI